MDMIQLDKVSPILSAFFGMLLLCDIPVTTASNGDKSYVFNKCFYQCKQSFCSVISDINYAARLPIPDKWIGWTCPDECDYNCMWETVEAFKKDGSGVPQFHGKWPFIRILGMQEPASVIFSILNAIPHIIMMYRLRKKVSESTPMYWMWHCYALVCLHAWLWSTIFHTRETPLTEKMDYFCAFSLVSFNLFTFCARIIGTHKPLQVGACFVAIASFYTYHIHYLANVKFDYGYNMQVNIAVGIVNCAGWILWALKVKSQQPYVKKLIIMMILLNCCALLEVLDFPPLFWTFDAHALWHAGSAPLGLLWYSFVIDDCLYLEKCSNEEENIDDCFIVGETEANHNNSVGQKVQNNKLKKYNLRERKDS